jgi:NAD(P)-dependent dehydrogenase (short-subunit alcohol dehydrogenase family)
MGFNTFEIENKPKSNRGELQMKLEGKVILITGASGGIGEAAAHAFDRAGARVAVASRRIEKLELLAGRMKNGLAVEADFCHEEQVREMVRKVISHFGAIDILINNAASIIVSPSDVVTAEDLLTAFRTNLIAPVVATQEAIIQMRRQGGGHIINVGSPGFMLGIPYYSPYVCSKAAFSAWTRTIQAEWAGTEIMVSEYFPGYIKTDSKPDSRLGEVEQDFLMASSKKLIPELFTKPKTPDDVARHLVRLAEKPKLLAWSGFSVKIGAYISHIPGFRLTIAKQMAANARKKKNLSIFTR